MIAKVVLLMTVRRESKKDTLLLPITLPNVDQFFHSQTHQ